MSGLRDKKVILIGIGNDGRGDDALGWQFADRLANNPVLEVAYRYQLQVEDAALISTFDCVVFVDATMQALEQGFSFQRCEPAASLYFSTHKIAPATVLWLAREIYQTAACGYILAIQGEYWDLHRGLSARATLNFDQAYAFFVQQILPQLENGEKYLDN